MCVVVSVFTHKYYDLLLRCSDYYHPCSLVWVGWRLKRNREDKGYYKHQTNNKTSTSTVQCHKKVDSQDCLELNTKIFHRYCDMNLAWIP